MINVLAARIWAHQRFHDEARSLRSYLLRARYIGGDAGAFDLDALKRLLRSATVLSASEEQKHRETAYQIATAATEIGVSPIFGRPLRIASDLKSNR